MFLCKINFSNIFELYKFKVYYDLFRIPALALEEQKLQVVLLTRQLIRILRSVRYRSLLTDFLHTKLLPYSSRTHEVVHYD